MIVKVEMFGCKCDNCGTEWSDDHNGFVAFSCESGMKSYIMDDDRWHKDDDKHYCPKCHSFDDEGELVITNGEKPYPAGE